jgi:Zn-finger nucleic acid-binding protein
MANCPTCKTSLRTIRQREGVFLNCDQCGGRAVSISHIRRFTGDRFATKLLVEINRVTKTSLLSCPFCNSPMKQLQTPQPAITLDACKQCVTVWFAAGEFEKLPEGVIESQDELRLRGAEAHGKLKLKGLDLQQKKEAADENSNQNWNVSWG